MMGLSIPPFLQPAFTKKSFFNPLILADVFVYIAFRRDTRCRHPSRMSRTRNSKVLGILSYAAR